MAKRKQPKRMGTLEELAEVLVESFNKLPSKERAALRRKWLADARKRLAESRRKTTNGEWVN